MKKALTVIVFAATAALMLSGCAGKGAMVTPAEPDTAVPTQNLMKPGLTKSLVTPTSAAQKFCPDVDAVHLNETDISLKTKEMKTAYVCITLQTLVPLEETSTEQVRVVTGGLMNLLEAYSKPNAEVDPTVNCIALAADPLIVNVVQGDTIIPVYAPVNVCGFPTDEAAAAFNELQLEPIPAASEEPVAIERPMS